MSTHAPHSIRRLYLELEAEGSQADAFALQHALPGLCRGALTAALGQALDRCCPAGGDLVIERLGVDAGAMDWSRLEHELPEAVRRAVERAVLAHVTPEAAPAVAAADAGSARYRTETQGLDEALVYFLRHGSLPASCHLAPGVSFEQTLLARWRAAAPPGGAPAALAATGLLRVLAEAAPRDRLTRQFSSVFLQALLARLGPQAGAAPAAIYNARGAAELSPDDAGRLERRLWQALFARLAAQRQPQVNDLIRGASARPAGGAARQARHVPAARQRAADPPATAGNGGRPTRPSAPHADAEEGIYVADAGLVLLHPFLGRLFERLALSDGKRLLRPDRALHLLHYLASGQDCAPEYELVLPKLLCNVALTEVVAAASALGTHEKTEAQVLLEAVIGHWTALRNTGADGLRGAFLRRNGRLSLRDDGWLLQVEQQTADVLLDQLPWGLSPLSLPWMDATLWVEWR